MRPLPAIVLGALLVACGGGEEESPRVTVADVGFVAPTDWQPSDITANARTWTPTNNRRKESITVIVAPKPLGPPERALDRARIAQGVLREGNLVASTPLVTSQGLLGNRFDSTFSPDVARGRLYHRSHVVVVSGERVIHVLYTARDPEPRRAALRGVLDSIREGG